MAVTREPLKFRSSKLSFAVVMCLCDKYDETEWGLKIFT